MRNRLFAIALALFAATAAAHAENYPSRPITIVVALPAGGAVDALARVLAEHMRVTLGQPIIVENMGGAGGTLSIARVVRSAPDGYTLGMGTLGQYVISGAVYTLPFDMLADLAPVALLPSVPYWMTARKTLPANNLLELVDLAQGQQGLGFDHRHREPGAVLRHVLPEGDRHAASSSCPIAAARRRCRTWWPAQIDLNCDLAANSLAQYRNGNIKALCGDGEDALVRGARSADHRRGRRARRLCQHLARHLGAQGHAGRHRRQDQRRRDGGDGRSGDAQAHRRSRHGRCRRPSSGRRRRSRRSTRPRSRSGIRSSRRRASRRSDRRLNHLPVRNRQARSPPARNRRAHI